MRAIAAIALLTGCSTGQLTISPTSLDFGEVDFQRIRPDAGYDPLELTLENTGGKELDVVVSSFDEEHLALGAFLVNQNPPTLAPLGEGSRVVLTVGVWDYQAGERDTLVEGVFQLTAEGMKDPVAVPWSFTPVRVIETETGE